MKATIQTSSFDKFENRVIEKARKMDRKEPIEPGITITFEDPMDMIKMLTDARMKLLRTTKEKQRMTISEIANKVGRDRRAIQRDLSVLENFGLIKSYLEPNPGHGKHKVVEACAENYTLMANF